MRDSISFVCNVCYQTHTLTFPPHLKDHSEKLADQGVCPFCSEDEYAVDDENGEPIPHDPDEGDFPPCGVKGCREEMTCNGCDRCNDHCDCEEGDDDFDSNLDTVPEPTHDLGEPVGNDPMSEEEVQWWREESRLAFDSARTIRKGDWL